MGKKTGPRTATWVKMPNGEVKKITKKQQRELSLGGTIGKYPAKAASHA